MVYFIIRRNGIILFIPVDVVQKYTAGQGRPGTKKVAPRGDTSPHKVEHNEALVCVVTNSYVASRASHMPICKAYSGLGPGRLGSTTTHPLSNRQYKNCTSHIR